MFDSAPLTWFTEDPMPLLVGCGFVLLLLGGFFLRSGRGLILVAMACVALLMGLAFVVDRVVVTDREQVANVIYEAAAAAERNDLESVLKYISPKFPDVKTEAQHWIRQAKIESVNVSAMEVTLDRKANPPKAQADFRVYATGQLTDSKTPYPIQYMHHITVYFQRERTDWLVIGYDRDN